MKRKFNLTPQAHKAIVELARTLPQIIRLNADGTQQVRVKTTYNGGKTYSKTKEPVLVNHEVELINRFWASGTNGVTEYCNNIKKLLQMEEAGKVNQSLIN
jgi:hypothetical protein